MENKYRYAVSKEEVDNNLLGLLEYENRIIEVDKKKLGIDKLLFTINCPICCRVQKSSLCLPCAAFRNNFNSCSFVGELKRQYLGGEISRNQILSKIWEQVVLTREWIWENWK